MTCIAAIAEKTDFNPRELRGKRHLCAQLQNPCLHRLQRHLGGFGRWLFRMKDFLLEG
jgi:hypothetical protein